MPEIVGTLKTPRLAAAPSSPVAGQMYFDTVANVLYWWNGTAWVSASGSTDLVYNGNYPAGGPPYTDGDLVVGADGILYMCVKTTNNAPVAWPGRAGPQGATGPQGPAGQGVPVGGTQGQALVKNSATNYDTVWGAAGADLIYDGNFTSGPTYKDGEIVVYTDANGRTVAYICTQQTTAAPIPWPGGPPPQSAYPTPAYSTALPASPTDGQEAILVDSTANPTWIWRLRYNASNGTAYKWEYLGGVPIRNSGGNVTVPTTGAVTDMPGCSITVPRAGVYRISFGASIYNAGTFGGAYQSSMTLYSGSTSIPGALAELRHHGAVYDGATVAMHTEGTLAAGALLNPKCAEDRTGSNTTFNYGWIEMYPRYIS